MARVTIVHRTSAALLYLALTMSLITRSVSFSSVTVRVALSHSDERMSVMSMVAPFEAEVLMTLVISARPPARWSAPLMVMVLWL